jgi:hypothetical protein
MKKFVSLIAAVCIAVSLSVTAFAEGGVFIADNADFFTDSEETRLFEKANDIVTENGWCLMIITEEGYFSESEARSELTQWYGDEFGSSERGAAYIMTSETGKAEGENDYALVIETFGGAAIDENRTYNRAEDAFLDYDEYGSAEAFLSGCGDGYESGSGSGAGSTSENSSESDGKTSPLAIIITAVLVVIAFIGSFIKRLIFGRSVGGTGGSYYRRNSYSGSSSRRSSSSSRSSGRRSSGGRTGKR